MAGPSPELADAIRSSAQRLGIDPSDLATAISYESAGTFSPSIFGGANKKYLGLIQFGPAEQQKYGVHPGQTGVEQMGAVENFLRDRGVKPGMGMLDLYSTINAGTPGRYNATDANNGGAPGTVADKVATQMVGHRQRANALLGVEPQTTAAPQLAVPASTTAAPAAPNQTAQPVPGSFAPGMAPETEEAQQQALQAPLQAIPQAIAKDSGVKFMDAPAINYPATAAMIRARALAKAAAQRPIG